MSAIELRSGRWQDALADVESVDTLITDPPYSERTHGAYREMESVNRRPLSYAAWDDAEVQAFVAHWSPRVRGWLVCLTDHHLIPAFEQAYEAAGRYAFAPLACVEPGSRVRISGDGPSQWSIFAMVSRPKTRDAQRWGALQGAYVMPYAQTRRGAGEGHGIMGGKPLWLMRALVRDYSRPGDLVCDPCAGGGTTLLAAAIEGRRAIGSEMDPATHALASKRVAKGYTPDMFARLNSANDNADEDSRQGGLFE